jgi:hypothetical protein
MCTYVRPLANMGATMLRSSEKMAKLPEKYFLTSRLPGPVEYRQATALVRAMLAVAVKYQH